MKKYIIPIIENTSIVANNLLLNHLSSKHNEKFNFKWIDEETFQVKNDYANYFGEGYIKYENIYVEKSCIKQSSILSTSSKSIQNYIIDYIYVSSIDNNNKFTNKILVVFNKPKGIDLFYTVENNVVQFYINEDLIYTTVNKVTEYKPINTDLISDNENHEQTKVNDIDDNISLDDKLDKLRKLRNRIK